VGIGFAESASPGCELPKIARQSRRETKKNFLFIDGLLGLLIDD
jgi:hypothetical protein